MKRFKDEVIQFPGVQKAAGSYYVPGSDIRFHPRFVKESDQNNQSVACGYNSVDEDFIPTYQFELIAGRNFSQEYATDKNAIIINESALRQLGFTSAQEALGANLIRDDHSHFKIIGVMPDYHHTWLKNGFEPIVFCHNRDVLNYCSLKIKTKNLKQSMAQISAKWREIFPGSPFDSFFMDEFFNEQYKKDQQFGKISLLFAALSIIIANLGLFSLTSLNILQRKKEVGIRKVVGAGITNILFLFSKDYLKLLLIANAVALPLSYYFVQSWLANYAFRMNMSWIVLLVPTSMVMLISLGTVTALTIKTALDNPVKSLKYE